MRVIVALAGALLVAVGSGCGDGGGRGDSGESSHSERISKATFAGTWPFSVDSGALRCEAPQSVVFSANGTDYGVNGSARDGGYPNVTPIWRKSHDPNAGPRVYVGDVIEEGLRLCGK